MHIQEHKANENSSHCFIHLGKISLIIPRLCSWAYQLCPIPTQGDGWLGASIEVCPFSSQRSSNCIRHGMFSCGNWHILKRTLYYNFWLLGRVLLDSRYWLLKGVFWIEFVYQNILIQPRWWMTYGSLTHRKLHSGGSNFLVKIVNSKLMWRLTSRNWYKYVGRSLRTSSGWPECNTTTKITNSSFKNGF